MFCGWTRVHLSGKAYTPDLKRALDNTCLLSYTFFTSIQIFLLELIRLCIWISLSGGNDMEMNVSSLSLSLYSSCRPLTLYAIAVLVYIKYGRKKNTILSFGSHSPASALADFCKCSLMQGSYARLLCHINGFFHMPPSNETHPAHVCSIICHRFTFWLEVENTTGWYPATRIHSSTLS